MATYSTTANLSGDTAAADTGTVGETVSPVTTTVAFSSVVVVRPAAPAPTTSTGQDFDAVTATGVGGGKVGGSTPQVGTDPFQPDAYPDYQHTPGNASGWGGQAVTSDTASETTWFLGPYTSPVHATEEFDRVLGLGTIIPTAYFRKVSGKVIDADTGEPIQNGIYITALDDFSVAGPVDEQGNFEMYLLKQTYTTFILTAEASAYDESNPEYDYVWYESAGNPDMSATDTYAELEFTTDVPASGPPPTGGLTAGKGVSFG